MLRFHNLSDPQFGTTDEYLSRLDINYTLFKPDGTPLRARVHAVFIGFDDEAALALKANKSSPDLSHVLTAKARDTLPLMSFQTYGSSAHYVQVVVLTVWATSETWSSEPSFCFRRSEKRRMTVPSPLTTGAALVSFTIKVAGKEISSTFQILSIDT